MLHVFVVSALTGSKMKNNVIINPGGDYVSFNTLIKVKVVRVAKSEPGDKKLTINNNNIYIYIPNRYNFAQIPQFCFDIFSSYRMTGLT